MAIKSFYSTSNYKSVIESMVVGRGDKRDFIRMAVESEIFFNRPGSEEKFSGMTADLSANGVHFTTEARVESGETLEILIKPVNDITPPLEATLSVIRADYDEEKQIYDVAGSMTPKA